MTTTTQGQADVATLGRPLRVLAFLHHAWPVQRGGSEVAVHGILKWLAARGHRAEAIVVYQRGFSTDGVHYAGRFPMEKDELWEWADVAFTQQAATDQASLYARDHGTPLAFYVHNLVNLEDKREFLDPARDLVVFNTRAVADSQGDLWSGRSTVVRPPIFPDEWVGNPGELVTQVNLSKLKGGSLFWELTRRRPETKFLAVIGGWGAQIAADGTEWWPSKGGANEEVIKRAPENVTVIAPTVDMLGQVYARTRVLLIPTGRVNANQVGESYGLVAGEALGSGIPVLATNSPGMAELLGQAGALLDPDNVDAWASALGALDDPTDYAVASARARARAIELDPTPELCQLERALTELVSVT